GGRHRPPVQTRAATRAEHFRARPVGGDRTPRRLHGRLPDHRHRRERPHIRAGHRQCCRRGRPLPSRVSRDSPHTPKLAARSRRPGRGRPKSRPVRTNRIPRRHRADNGARGSAVREAFRTVVTGVAGRGRRRDATTKSRIPAFASGLLLTGGLTAEAQQVVNVQTWGGSLGESFQKNIVEPFEAETGIDVVLSYGMAADALAKVRAQQANPQVDIAMMGQTEAISLWNEGLLDVLDPAEIPNLANLVDSAVYADDDGSIFYVGMYGYVLELIYRTDRIDNPPES